MTRHRTSDPRFEIHERSSDGHRSLHVRCSFQPGQTLASFAASSRLAEPSVHTVQVNASEHILLDPDFLQYTNHSCSPNVLFDVRRMVVTALEPIHAGDEIQYFYPSTETSMRQPFSCTCRSVRCLGWIQGATHIAAHVLEQYHVADHIRVLVRERDAMRPVPGYLCKVLPIDAR